MRPRKKRLWIKPIRPRKPIAPNPVTTPTKIATSESRKRPIFGVEIDSPLTFGAIIVLFPYRYWRLRLSFGFRINLILSSAQCAVKGHESPVGDDNGLDLGTDLRS